MSKVSLQGVCDGIVNDVDGALGCALVHLETGLPLALSAASGHAPGTEAVEVLCAAGATWFGDAAADDPVQELQAATADALVFMALVPGQSDGLFVLALDRDATNLGLGWMAMRRALDAVGAGQRPGR